MRRERVILSMLLGAAATVTLPTAASQSRPDAANWCVEAERHLTDGKGLAIQCSDVNTLCVRLNNYWCQKHGSDPWRGTANKAGINGNRDRHGHAVFESGRWSARAIAMDLRTKYRSGLVSALQIASKYSPWCDTLGSVGVYDKSGYGRTCKDGGAKPPSGFKGPYCEEPGKKNPEPSDCAPGCNCPPEIAQTLSQGLTLGIHDDLQLFDKTGAPLPNLSVVIRNLAWQEQRIHVRPSLIEAGVEMLSQ